MDILIQPAASALLAAYKPIEFQVRIDIAPDDCPIMFCDVYINGTYYKSQSKTYAYLINPGVTKTFQFDIQDVLQEYLTKYIAPCGGTTSYQHLGGMVSVLCKFRSTFYNIDGFIDSTYTEPIQATVETAAVAGTGEDSTTFYVVNASIQQKEIQSVYQHLDRYKYGTWLPDLHPITHRPPSCEIKLGQSDYYPILSVAGIGLICYILNYKMKGDLAYSQYNSCGEGGPVASFDWIWNKVASEFVDITTFINQPFQFIDWGDGIIDTNITHTYGALGNYHVIVYNCLTTIFDAGTLDFGTHHITNIGFNTPSPVTILKVFNNQIGGLTVNPNLSNLVQLKADDNLITVINGTIPTNVNKITLANNQLDTAAINQILIDLDANGVLNGDAQLHSQTPPAPPSGAGAAAKTSLLGKGWSVVTD